MATAKVEIETYDGSGDFNMWRKKIKVVLVQQKRAKALSGEKDLDGNISASDK